MNLRIHSWSLEGRYQETPLFFVELSPLPEEAKIALLTEIESWYGERCRLLGAGVFTPGQNDAERGRYLDPPALPRFG